MSSTRVHRKGEKTVVYMNGQQLHGSGSNITISCGQGPSKSRCTVYRMPNAGTMTTETGGPSCLPGYRTTTPIENTASASSDAKIVRIVPRGTTILLEEVKAPPKAQSARSKSGGGAATITVVEECDSGVGYDASPERPEPGPAEHCIECLAELAERRRSKHRREKGSRSQRKVTSKFTAEVSEQDDDDGMTLRACPNCGGPLTPVPPTV